MPIRQESRALTPRSQDAVERERSRGEILPWHRMEGETPRAYDAFLRYLALGPSRSHKKLREGNQESVSLGDLEEAALASVDLAGSIGRGIESASEDGNERERGKVRDRLHIPQSTAESYSRDNGWVRRAAAWDSHLTDLRATAEAEAIQADVELAHARKRKLRDDAWNDVEKLLGMIRRYSEPLPDGSPRELAPKEIRELAIARERLGIVAKEAFYGLPDAPVTPTQEDMPPDMAAAFAAFLVQYQQPRPVVIDVTPR